MQLFLKYQQFAQFLSYKNSIIPSVMIYYIQNIEVWRYFFMNRLLIIDGSNLLFQMFFGMPARITNQNGKAIQGTLGFVGALLKIIRKTTPTHLVVLFDGEHENERTSLDANYKANRVDYSQTPEEETPFSQLPDVYDALDYLNIKHTETTDCETDDIIASYAYTYGSDCEIIISSFDSDFFQLINDKVSIFRYRGSNSVVCTPAYIEEKLSIKPSQYADYKSLTGDTADNIKGAPKVGPKTAASLINEFSSLEGILKNADKIAKPSIRASIQENTNRLRTNYALIKLDNHASLPFTLDELTYQYSGITTTEVLFGIKLKP